MSHYSKANSEQVSDLTELDDLFACHLIENTNFSTEEQAVSQMQVNYPNLNGHPSLPEAPTMTQPRTCSHSDPNTYANTNLNGNLVSRTLQNFDVQQFFAAPQNSGSTLKDSESELLDDLLKVAEEHDIEDLGQRVPPTQNPQPAQFQPTNVLQSPTFNQMPVNQPEWSQGGFSTPTPPAQNFPKIMAAPASDTRRYNQLDMSPSTCSIASSPGGRFAAFQDEDPSSNICLPAATLSPPQSKHANSLSNPVINEAQTAMPHQVEDVASPPQNSNMSAGWAWSPAERALTNQERGKTFDDNDSVFYNDNSAKRARLQAQCTSHPTSHRGYSYNPNISQTGGNLHQTNSLALSAGNRSVNNFNQFNSVKVHRSTTSAGFMGSNSALPTGPRSCVHMASVSSTSYISTSDLQNSKLNEDAKSCSDYSCASPLSEHDRLDAKRVRNNIACRESRKRRKRKAEQMEERVIELEDENGGLKRRARQLEQQLEMVRRQLNIRVPQN